MQHTKYFVEGIAAAHAGSIRATRYKVAANVLEWFAGFDSVDRSYAVFKILPGVGRVTLSDLDPVYVGSLKQCQDRAFSIQQADRSGAYVIYDLSTGKPYQATEEKLTYKK
ncbi:hypothetical protein EXT67_20580 [Pectobacterium atrosepticum]|uniref:Uncharacterized protein n=1 Tax=Pectobacterium phage phiTE TaxID=1116482 RepID=K9L4X4_9CAUD|nr:hypothetical protein [Pectobacterium atrosepticum]YP_007392542.1 hypothetical protein phiTE_080 [Pectobacterium phage phiTE]AEZ66246.1 hypothetical protein phiTE_080 [Pectobacterium phage phiTE]MCL6318702.1 hypothetical protein [Pectobacterium atrosepticum]